MVWEKPPGWQYIGDQNFEGVFLQNVHDMVIRDRRLLSEDGFVLPIIAMNKQTRRSEGLPEIVSAVLGRLGAGTFPVVVCAADVAHAKPDPEGYLLAAARLGAEPGSCIALEDSRNGVTAAETAGYRVVAVPSVVPVPGRPGRPVLSSLAGVTLAELAALTGLRLP